MTKFEKWSLTHASAVLVLMSSHANRTGCAVRRGSLKNARFRHFVSRLDGGVGFLGHTYTFERRSAGREQFDEGKCLSSWHVTAATPFSSIQTLSASHSLVGRSVSQSVGRSICSSVDTLSRNSFRAQDDFIIPYLASKQTEAATCGLLCSIAISIWVLMTTTGTLAMTQ